MKPTDEYKVCSLEEAEEFAKRREMNNEPVAWMSNGKEFYVQKNYCPDFIPLYTHPVKELTDEEIEEIYYKDFNHDGEDMLEFARAILKKASEK